MAITAITRDFNNVPNIVRVVSTDNLAAVVAANYILNQTANITALNAGTWTWLAGDIVLVQASDGDQFFQFSGTNFNTLVTLPGGNGAVTLPVVANDFVNFNGTTGALKDSGYLPSNAAKTNVVMANGASIVNHIATYVDTAGTIGEDATTAINGGNIQAGLSGTAGTIASFPATASKGSLILAGVANTDNTNTTISNVAMGQASVISIPDPAGATADFVIAPAALVSGNLVQASGTAGLIQDAGIPAANIQLNTVTITLNQAAVQAAYATPFSLIAAPGAGKVIIVDHMSLYTNFQTSAFAAGGVGIVQYAATIHGAGTNALSATIPAAEITAAASQIYGLGANNANALTAITNAGIYFSNQTQAFSGGSASSTLVITLTYFVITATV
jgi:hypothetical protein